MNEGAIVAAADIGEGGRARAAEMGVEILDPETVYDAPCDIFSPNALGGTINEATIPRIKAKIIAGGANNQLMTPADGLTLHKKGVIYAPDYLINAGGIINVATEIDGPYTVERAEERTKTHLRQDERSSRPVDGRGHTHLRRSEPACRGTVEGRAHEDQGLRGSLET